MRQLGSVLAVLLGVGISSAHAAVVMCARPRSDGTFKTTIKLRTGTCAPHETQLDPGALGLQGPKGTRATLATSVHRDLGSWSRTRTATLWARCSRRRS